jgi:monofunctional biosynthetic peptidoglycan transglycosylase
VDHWGFDLEAIDKAVGESKHGNRRLRGASTISQQTAKNVFLWPGRSWVRKSFEVWFTGWVELLWSKKRILQVYLNSIEMGNGIYGAEAASQYYFKIPAHQLTARQAAAIAAVLPNPRRYSAATPGPYISGRISWITGQMRKYGTLDLK